MGAEGWIIDADSGRRHRVSVMTQGHSLVVDRDDGRRQSFVPEALIPLERRDGTEIYGLNGVDTFRLALTAIDDRLVEARLPEFPPPPRRRNRFVPLALLAAGLGVAAGLAAPFQG